MKVTMCVENGDEYDYDLEDSDDAAELADDIATELRMSPGSSVRVQEADSKVKDATLQQTASGDWDLAKPRDVPTTLFERFCHRIGRCWTFCGVCLNTQIQAEYRADQARFAELKKIIDGGPQAWSGDKKSHARHLAK